MVDLLYVGVTRNFKPRMLAHRSKSDWFKFAVEIHRFVYPCRADALQAEREAIIEEQPLFNRDRSPVITDSWTNDELANEPCYIYRAFGYAGKDSTGITWLTDGVVDEEMPRDLSPRIERDGPAANGGPNCPPNLNDRARRLWRSVIRDYPDLMDHQLALLRRLVETMTRVDLANDTILREGFTYHNEKTGAWVKRPEVDIVKDGITAERLITKELYLDIDEEDPI